MINTVYDIKIIAISYKFINSAVITPFCLPFHPQIYEDFDGNLLVVSVHFQLTLNAPKQQTYAKFQKTFHVSCIKLRILRPEGKQCKSRYPDGVVQCELLI